MWTRLRQILRLTRQKTCFVCHRFGLRRRLDDERLLAVAGSISDGMPVDWDEVRQRFAGPATTAIVDELQVLHGLAAIHLEPSGWGSLQTYEAIGQGSFATVYRAFDTELQREIALKITLPPDSSVFDSQRAVREARLLARVRHPNVVTVFGAQRRGEAVAIAMELIKGRTLEDLVRSQGPLSAREATLIGLDLCRALAAVHEAGLLHGDIKAHNVVREEGGRIVLMDFGTGRDLQTVAPSTGDFAGTPLYLAPEVFAGQPRSKGSDIYSLGVLLYYLSSGTYPVSGDTLTAIDRRHAQPGSRRRLRDARPDLPAEFVAVVERAAAEDPAERHQTAGVLEAALLATLDRPVEPKGGKSGSRTSMIAAAALVAVGLTALWIYGIPLASNIGDVPETGASARAAVTTPVTTPSAAAAAGTDGVYRVQAAMYRVKNEIRERLQRSDRLAPNDELFLEVQTSAPTYVYVVNEDAHGVSLLLYPLPGQQHEALPPDVPNRVPGVLRGEEFYWKVSTPGEQEHFVIFFSPTRVSEVEQLVRSLPAPREDAQVTYATIAPEVVSNLRSVGGLASRPDSKIQSHRLSDVYTTALSDGPEEARGLCVRQITFANPLRR